MLAEHEHAAAAEEGLESSDDRRASTTTLLVCLVGDERIAIPLALVARLEEFDRTIIERTGGREVIQYRGGLLHIHDLHQLLMPGRPAREFAEDEPLRVVVYELNERSYGLIVDEVIDVFDADLSDGETTTHEGLALTAVIGRRVTDLLDIEMVIENYDREPALAASH